MDTKKEYLHNLYILHITTHALKRWLEYTKEINSAKNKKWTTKRIKIVVAKKFTKELKRGLFIDKTGAIHVPVKYGLYAAIILKENGYLIITFHKNEKNINIDKLRKRIKKDPR